MEGRWAQLAVDAHIAHAIDYSKPVSELAEDIIFLRLEMHRMLLTGGLYPTLSDGDARIYLSSEWVEELQRNFTPWVYAEEQASNNGRSSGAQPDVQKGIELLKEYRAKHNL